MQLTIDKFETWAPVKERPLIISGPCSAESEEQLLDTCSQLYAVGIRVMRAGVWKPRTRPGGFEGIGKEALNWINAVKRKFDVKFAVEVGNPEHVEACLEAGIDILWVGARSTVNPFTVQEIADALKGVDVPVLIKNPINPDLALWLGAIERINKAGITKLGAIHRGFSSFQKTKYRNVPAWQFPIELKREFPHMPLLGDPSHICGNREMLLEVAQRALDLNYDGLMIESHRDPDNAWSDAKQQVTPSRLAEMLKELKPKSAHSSSATFNTFMEEMRDQIDNADREILEALANRMRLVEKIGEYKRDNNVTIFQVDRWNEIYKSRAEWGKTLSLSPDFVEETYKLIHVNSIRCQTEIMTQVPAGDKGE